MRSTAKMENALELAVVHLQNSSLLMKTFPSFLMKVSKNLIRNSLIITNVILTRAIGAPPRSIFGTSNTVNFC